MRRPRFGRRSAGRQPSWLGGVNLLPYRARAARRQRIYRLQQATGVAACACIWLALPCLADLSEARQADARRIEVERHLARADTAAHSGSPATSQGQMSALVASRASLLAGWDALGRLPYEGVRLHALRGDARGFSMRIEAHDPAAAQTWLARLRERWPNDGFEIEDLRAPVTNHGAVPASPQRGVQALMLTVRMLSSVLPQAEGVPKRRDPRPGAA
jgi:hypothetical protein